jgi:ABC-type transport system involved in multi-copper enzyme maturation permease subunit
MKKLLFISILLFGIICSLIAQQNAATIFRHGGHLRYEGLSYNIDKQELSQILDENAFSQYKLARREHVAAIPLWVLSGAGLAAASTFVGFGIDADMSYYDPDSPVTSPGPYLYMVAGVFFGVTLVTFIPALVLTIDSHSKLNRIANGYNQHKVSLNPSVGPSGIGLSIKF